MNIISARFIKGIIGTDDILYDGRFQVAFLGRSNVGKSTLINFLTKKKYLARSSVSPGKTIRMDFFLINNKFYFVDFPGYGYAKRSRDKREKLAKMMLWYLLDSGVKNRLIVLIIDAKIGVTPDDADMLRILRENNIDHIIVANKVDKLKMGQYKNSDAIPHSSKQKFTGDNMMEKIAAFIK